MGEEKKRVRPTMREVRELEAEISRLTEENRLLAKSNEYLQSDEQLAFEEREKMVSDLDAAMREVSYYRNRSFFGKLKDLFS